MIRKILKTIGIILLLIFIAFYTAFRVFTSPKSNQTIIDSYKESSIKPILTREKFKGFPFRKITIQKDSSLPNLVFVHGTTGSLNDFSKYLTDSILQAKFSMVAYDRIGYNYKDENPVQESIAFERDMLLNIIKGLDKKKTILLGYSYGGSIALAVKEKVEKIILLAPAVYSKEEFIPRVINFYKWKLTRWLVPKTWKEASKEKLSHQEDLRKFESDWEKTPNKILSIHGSKDWIVPYKNSILLEEKFPENQFDLITIDNANHDLVWSDFNFIKEQLLKSSD